MQIPKWLRKPVKHDTCFVPVVAAGAAAALKPVSYRHAHKTKLTSGSRQKKRNAILMNECLNAVK